MAKIRMGKQFAPFRTGRFTGGLILARRLNGTLGHDDPDLVGFSLDGSCLGASNSGNIHVDFLPVPADLSGE